MKTPTEWTLNGKYVVDALDRGETVEFVHEDGRIFQVVERPTPIPVTATIESRAAMFDSWKGEARLIEGWDSPEVNAEIWEEFWASLEDEEPIPSETKSLA